MKKMLTIISTICIILLLSIFLPFKTVKAEETPLSLEDVGVSDKSYSVGIEKVEATNNEVDNTMFFNKVGDFIEYEVTIKNNSEQEVTIQEIVDDNTSEFITYEYPDSEGKVVAAGATDSFHIKAVYVKSASNENLTNDPVNFGIRYLEGKVTNALTLDPIVIYLIIFFISVIIFTFALIREKKLSKCALLLLLSLGIIIPLKTNADSFSLEIKLNNEIKVKTISYLKKGPDLCLQIHKLTAHSDTFFETADHYGYIIKYAGNVGNKIETVVHNLSKATEEQYNSIKNSLTSDNTISLEDSELKAYIWLEGDTLYYYSEADTIFMNPDSSIMFNGFRNLTSMDLSGFDSTNVTNMELLFYDLESIQNIDVSNLYTGNVTNMRGMFFFCQNLQALDVSGFDSSKVNDMSFMFAQCNELSNLNTIGLETGNVTNMKYMFASCYSFYNLDISHFDTSNVTNMYYMFCDNFGEGTINLSGLDLRKVTDMSFMFSCCEDKEHIIFDNAITRDLTKMSGMFSGCYNVIELNLNGFDTSNVTDMYGVFSENYNLVNLNISSFDTRNVTNMNSMFCECKSIDILDLSNFNTANVQDMNSMFACCDNLEKIYVSDTFTTDSVVKGEWMFSDSPNLVGEAGTTYDCYRASSTYAHIDEGETNPGYFTRKEN